MTPSKALSMIIALMILVSILVVYWNTLVMRDFVIVNDVDTETETE